VSALQAEITAGQRELASLDRKAPDGEEALLKEEILRKRKTIEGKISRAREELAAIHHNRKAMVERLCTKWKGFIVLAGPSLVLLVPALVLAASLLRRIPLPGRLR
jgi:hypothetical protein